MRILSTDEPSERAGRINLRPVLLLAWGRFCTSSRRFHRLSSRVLILSPPCYATAIGMGEARQQMVKSNNAPKDNAMSTNTEATNTQSESTVSGLGGMLYTYIGILVMVFIQTQLKSDKPTVGKEVVATGKEVLASFQTISDADTHSLVGLSTGQFRQRLGKPDSVSFPRTLGNTVDLPVECWSYFRKINHEASGKKLTLNCYVQDGKCVSVKLR